MDPAEPPGENNMPPKHNESNTNPLAPTVHQLDVTMESTAMKGAAPPIKKVIHIVEMMENILKHVPMRDLLVNAQRTCKVRQELREGTRLHD